jgi:hypothetical protein
MTGWGEIIGGIIAADDRIKSSQREREQINALANSLRNIASLEVRRRKGKIIKLLRQWHKPSIGFHYDRQLIRFCILQSWLADASKV